MKELRMRFMKEEGGNLE